MRNMNCSPGLVATAKRIKKTLIAGAYDNEVAANTQAERVAIVC
jgi:hypothetical protein